MIPDKKLMHDILSILKDVYPGRLTDEAGAKLDELRSNPDWIANMCYLEDHGLLHSGLRRGVNGIYDGEWYLAKITKKGIDFVLEDGGLTTILDTVTVKLHPDTIRELCEDKINASSLSEADKTSLLAKMKSMTAEGLKAFLGKLVDKGIDAFLSNPQAVIGPLS